MKNEILSLIMSRHCKRAYLPTPVPREILEAVLQAAAHAPSTRNSQLWQVAVLMGRSLETLATKLCAAFDQGVPPKLDYVSRPSHPDPELERRARMAAVGLREIKGIAEDDAQARRTHQRQDYLFHGAPVELIFHLPAGSPPGTFLEMGFFIQNVMLGLIGCGLASCPQGSVAGYPDLIREHLGLGPERLIVCGLAVGYVDESAPVNRFVPERALLGEYTRWFD
jgi:nitroreductase